MFCLISFFLSNYVCTILGRDISFSLELDPQLNKKYPIIVHTPFCWLVEFQPYSRAILLFLELPAISICQLWYGITQFHVLLIFFLFLFGCWSCLSVICHWHPLSDIHTINVKILLIGGAVCLGSLQALDIIFPWPDSGQLTFWQVSWPHWTGWLWTCHLVLMVSHSP